MGNCKKTNIGGQAVIEGVMMRGKKGMAIAVRDAEGNIRLETKRLKSSKGKAARIPVVRGVVNFISMLAMGVDTLMRSAAVFGEGEPSKFEKWVAKKLKINIMTAVLAVSLLLGIGLAVALFILLPTFLTDMIYLLFDISKNEHAVLYSVIVGVFKVIILICYVLSVSFIKDIRRTFMYHGAEHKTIKCYESGEELTVQNIQKHSTLHNRCGTTFLFYVIFLSVIVFIALQAIFTFSIIDNYFLQVGIRILAIPLVAGLAYEMLRFLAKYDLKILLPLKLPGLALQKITTKEPDDDMVEVALTAFNATLKLEEDDTAPEVNFDSPRKTGDVMGELVNMFNGGGVKEARANAEFIIAHVLKVERGGIFAFDNISFEDYRKIKSLAKQRAEGKPLQYVLGEVVFYGCRIKLTPDVLIPRFETELLADTAARFIKPGGSVLDLCTGSGCIAVSLQKKTGCKMTAADISEKAIETAKKNAELNSASVEFIVSDMFDNLKGRKFDVIISNPPYIKSGDIEKLEKEVKDYEPVSALDGGEDGLKYYKIIAGSAPQYLNDGGRIFIELEASNAEKIKELFDGFDGVEIHNDLDGAQRILSAVKRG